MKPNKPQADTRAVDAIVKAIAGGDIKPLYVLYGDEALTEEGARRISEAVVPEGARDFNLERVDGTVGARDFLARLNTYGFFPGRKAVVVSQTGLFMSTTNAGDLFRRASEAWEGNQKGRAGKLFLQLLALAGIDVAALREGQPEKLEKKEFKEAFGVARDEGTVAVVRDLSAYCNEGELSPAQMGDEQSMLLAALEKGLPARGVLVLTAPAVDKRRKVFKRVEEVGQVVDLSIDFGWRENELPQEVVQDLVQARCRAAGKRLGAGAVEAIAARTGASVRALQSELEKLLGYVGDRPVIEEADVVACMTRGKEAHRFDVTDALSSRDVSALVKALHGLSGEGAGAGAGLALIGTLAGGVRQLIQARGLLDGELRGRFRPSDRYNDVKAALESAAKSVGGMNPYRLYMLLQAASRYRMSELIDALMAVQETDVALKSSSVHRDSTIQLEALAFRICGAPREVRPRR